MTGIPARRFVRTAVLPAALLMAVSGSAVAFAGEPAIAAQQYPNYTMRLSPSAPRLRAGESTTVSIRFRAGHRLYGVPVEMSVTGLPSGVTASFTPDTPLIGEPATLTLTSAGFPKGTFTASVTAITISSDPIGTTAPLNLTIG
jgi:hypothetical protein